MILAGLCIAAGIFGSLVPLLPGPPVSYLGLLLLHFTSRHPFSTEFLLIYAGLTVLVVVLDNLIPVLGARKFNGSSYGTWGSALGLVAGLVFFPPLGIIIGPILGAFAGELIRGTGTRQALRSAMGSFIGFLAGTAIKVILSLVMAYQFISVVL